MEQTTDRVGLYIRPDTRNRLNLLKAQLALRLGESLSQDDTIRLLMEHADIDEMIEGIHELQPA